MRLSSIKRRLKRPRKDVEMVKVIVEYEDAPSDEFIAPAPKGWTKGAMVWDVYMEGV